MTEESADRVLPPAPRKDKRQARLEREAAALRENLLRRKQQSRQRDIQKPEDPQS